MATPRALLNVPYGAYLAREVPPPDDELTRVGPGTPGGEYLRRFWQPVAFARDLGAAPLRVRIMAEDLVVFRDRSGRVGLLQLHCTHRGTSLEYGVIEERGIRCCYHGWAFDVESMTANRLDAPHTLPLLLGADGETRAPPHARGPLWGDTQIWPAPPTWRVGQMRACVFRLRAPGAGNGAAEAVITAEAAGAVPDAVAPVEMAADAHA